MSIRLSEITFKAGPTSRSAALQITPEHLLLLVGPNNSGKTRALMEITGICNGQEDTPRIVVDNIRFELPATATEILSLMRQFEIQSVSGGGFIMNRRVNSFG